MKESSTKHIYILSACDRFNYGDLLFPIVAKHEIAKLGEYHFHNVATVKSNLKECGALPTLGYKSLFDYKNIPDNSTLLIAGGQVLNANWSRLISFLKPIYHDIFEKYSGAKLEKITKLIWGNGALSFPFMPSNKHLLNHFKLAYHAVGGGVPRQVELRNEVAPSIKQAKYVSVRETDTQRVIKNNFGVTATLVPDSVMVLSDLYPKSSLSREGLPEKYACVQFGFFKSKGKHQMILNQLTRIHKEHGLTIGLLSIGQCPGHDDVKMVEWIKENANFPVCVLPCDTIDEITCALAHAKIYIGTSLHGVIVSMSYGNPFVSVNKLVKKVDTYTKTWAPDYLKGSVIFLEMANTVSKRLEAHIDYSTLVDEQKRLVRQSFQRIHQVAQLEK
ncbi:MAG: hypothetical protein ACJASL_001946 [Paraglaciecola sp.]|jgi:hypothetical protein